MKVRFILFILFALFATGNVMSAEKYKGLDLVLRGEIGRETNRSVSIIPIEAIQGDDGLVHILFSAPVGTVQIIVDGKVQETCVVNAAEYETAFSVQGWKSGIYTLEFKTPEGGYVCGEFVIAE